MSSFSVQGLQDKLTRLSMSQDSIETLSLWIIHHKSHTSTSIGIWLEDFNKANADRRLMLFYLANDILQNSRRRGANSFLDDFKDPIRKAVTLIGGQKIQTSVERMFRIWKERRIYDNAFLKELEKLIEPARKTQHAAVNQPTPDFKLHLMEDALTEFRKFEAELKVKSSYLANLRVDISDPAASLSLLKDKSAGGRVSSEFDEASQRLQDYCECLGIEVNERINTIDLLNEAKLFTAYRLTELKRTATEYKSLDASMKEVQTKLEQRLKDLQRAQSTSTSDPAAKEDITDVGDMEIESDNESQGEQEVGGEMGGANQAGAAVPSQQMHQQVAQLTLGPGMISTPNQSMVPRMPLPGAVSTSAAPPNVGMGTGIQNSNQVPFQQAFPRPPQQPPLPPVQFHNQVRPRAEGTVMYNRAPPPRAPGLIPPRFQPHGMPPPAHGQGMPPRIQGPPPYFQGAGLQGQGMPPRAPGQGIPHAQVPGVLGQGMPPRAQGSGIQGQGMPPRVQGPGHGMPLRAQGAGVHGQGMPPHAHGPGPGVQGQSIPPHTPGQSMLTRAQGPGAPPHTQVPGDSHPHGQDMLPRMQGTGMRPQGQRLNMPPRAPGMAPPRSNLQQIRSPNIMRGPRPFQRPPNQEVLNNRNPISETPNSSSVYSTFKPSPPVSSTTISTPITTAAPVINSSLEAPSVSAVGKDELPDSQDDTKASSTIDDRLKNMMAQRMLGSIIMKDGGGSESESEDKPYSPSANEVLMGSEEKEDKDVDEESIPTPNTGTVTPEESSPQLNMNNPILQALYQYQDSSDDEEEEKDKVAKSDGIGSGVNGGDQDGSKVELSRNVLQNILDNVNAVKTKQEEVQKQLLGAPNAVPSSPNDKSVDGQISNSNAAAPVERKPVIIPAKDIKITPTLTNLLDEIFPKLSQSLLERKRKQSSEEQPTQPPKLESPSKMPRIADSPHGFPRAMRPGVPYRGQVPGNRPRPSLNPRMAGPRTAFGGPRYAPRMQRPPQQERDYDGPHPMQHISGSNPSYQQQSTARQHITDSSYPPSSTHAPQSQPHSGPNHSPTENTPYPAESSQYFSSRAQSPQHQQRQFRRSSPPPPSFRDQLGPGVLDKHMMDAARYGQSHNQVCNANRFSDGPPPHAQQHHRGQVRMRTYQERPPFRLPRPRMEYRPQIRPRY